MDQIIIDSLYKSDDGSHWYYNDDAERLITETFITDGSTGSYSQTEGYSPEYDIITHEGTAYEIKIQGTKDCFLEFEQKNHYNKWVPSGISLSKADYYLMLNMGWSKILGNGEWKKVGKVRLFSHADLVVLLGRSDDYTEFKGNVYGKGARGLYFDSMGVTHDWLGEVDAIVENDKVVGYDFTKIYYNKGR